MSTRNVAIFLSQIQLVSIDVLGNSIALIVIDIFHGQLGRSHGSVVCCQLIETDPVNHFGLLIASKNALVHEGSYPSITGLEPGT